MFVNLKWWKWHWYIYEFHREKNGQSLKFNDLWTWNCDKTNVYQNIIFKESSFLNTFARTYMFVYCTFNLIFNRIDFFSLFNSVYFGAVFVSVRIFKFKYLIIKNNKFYLRDKHKLLKQDMKYLNLQFAEKK